MNAAFVGNTGHFHNEIDLAASEGLDTSKDLFVFLVSATFWSCRFQARQSDDEIDLTSSESLEGMKDVNIRPQKTFRFHR